MSNVRLAYYVSGRAGRLRKLLESNSPTLSKTFLVISDSMENVDLNEALRDRNIHLLTIDYKSLGEKTAERRAKLSKIILQNFNKFEITHMFCFGRHVLTGRLLKEYKFRLINFHPSILPTHKGINAIDKAMENGDFLIGNTAHFIVPEIDSGPIIMSSVTTMKNYIDNGYDAVLNLQIEMANQIFYLLTNDLLDIKNDKVIIKGADYYGSYIMPKINIQAGI